MKQIQVTLKTLSPVVLSAMSNATVMTASHDYFSGSILRGIFAKRYIAEQNLGDKAHEDAEFVHLFFDSLRFTAAHPLVAGKRTFPAPFSLQRSKDGKHLLDLLHEEGKPGFKSLKGFIAVDHNEISSAQVVKTINLHMSRNDQKNKDGKERLAGRSLAGGIYNYEAIDAGQTFMANIYGEEDDLLALQKALTSQKWQCFAGRSKYTQYGHCEIQLGQIEPVSENTIEVQNNAICLRLDAPLLQSGRDISSVEQGLSVVAEAMNAKTGNEFSVCVQPQKVFAKTEAIENFVGIWGMKRPRVQALAAGTVFFLQKDEAWTEKDKEALASLLYAGAGSRTEEGFGQLRLWPNQHWQLATAEVTENKSKRVVQNKEVQKLAVAIIKQHLLEQAQIWAAEDVQEAKRYFPENSAHFFSRLNALLGAKSAGAQEHLRYGITVEMGNPSTPFAKGLQRIAIRERKLQWYLMEANLSEMPYNQRNWQELADDLQLPKIFQAISVDNGLSKLQASADLFYVYWHWFFRYARKAAAGTGKGDEAE